MNEESQLVILFPLSGLHYVREGPTPKGAYRVAYTLDSTGDYIEREWFLYHDWHDGVELLPSSDAPMVRADSIALNKPTTAFDPRLTVVVPRKPVRLLERWQQYHATFPRVINSTSIFQRFKRWLA
jgi:hypothetical protein